MEGFEGNSGITILAANDIIEDISHSTRAEGAGGMAKLTILRHNFSPESFQRILKCARHFVW
mgnify:CR=1 FL=1